jgi:Zn-dependent protease/CBS domain-containing protein
MELAREACTRWGPRRVRFVISYVIATHAAISAFASTRKTSLATPVARTEASHPTTMKSQIKLGRFLGVELGLHYSWFVIALLIMFSLAARFHAVDPDWSRATVWGAAIVTSVLFFAGLFAHELSHAMVARARGLPIHQITLFLLGGVAQIEKEPRDPSTEFWMGIAGPITSGLIGAGLLAIARVLGWRPWESPTTPGTAILVWLGYINLALGAFNMIPGFPLDGGRVLRAAIWWVTGDEYRATRIAARIGQLVAIAFIAYGILSFFGGNGLNGVWMAFIGWFLLQASSASLIQQRTGSLLRGLRVKDVMSRDCPAVNGDMRLQEFVDDELLRTGRRCYLVMEDHHVAGLITPHEVRGIERGQWTTVRVRDAMRQVDEVHSLAPNAPALDALETMARQDVNQLPVVEHGVLEGVVSRGHLLQVLQSRAELAGEDSWRDRVRRAA